MRDPRDYYYLAIDFVRFLRGKDYFRQKQGLGRYFDDRRCYYNDLRGKADWDGAYIDGVPALFVPSLNKNAISPCMVLLYGLGCADRFFLEGSEVYARKARDVASWLLANVNGEGYWDGFAGFDPRVKYYSTNSCMNQGLALSFIVRFIEHLPHDRAIDGDLRALAGRVFANMMLPLAQMGTAVRRGDDLYLCEFATHDECVVLNGWIFGVFGLMDYARFSGDRAVKEALDATVRTMEKTLPVFAMKNGWSVYDDQGRVSSPMYQELHISLLDAMHRLTGRSPFGATRDLFARGNSRRNRLRYMARKIVEKAFDQGRYGSSRAG